MNGVALFFAYLKRYGKVILMFSLFVGIFALVFSLYNLPREAVWYAALLCFVLGVFFFLLGYLPYLSRHRRLLELLRNSRFSLDDLPRPKGVVEADYQALARSLFQEKQSFAAHYDVMQSEATDYYTLWVHQIKTPIAAMELLLQAEEAPQTTALSAELFKIEQYVEMVLSYLRLDSEQSDFLLRSYDLDGIIRQALRKYARLFALGHLRFEFRETGLTVLTDEKWLCFVIEQVLSNALKYTFQGGIRIYGEGETLVIEDTGIGIQSEDLPRVFEKGFTGYNGRADKKSTGIGLYLCRRICLKLGHEITIQSQVGRGTRVLLHFAQKKPVLE